MRTLALVLRSLKRERRQPPPLDPWANQHGELSVKPCALQTSDRAQFCRACTAPNPASGRRDTPIAGKSTPGSAEHHAADKNEKIDQRRRRRSTVAFRARRAGRRAAISRLLRVRSSSLWHADQRKRRPNETSWLRIAGSDKTCDRKDHYGGSERPGCGDATTAGFAPAGTAGSLGSRKVVAEPSVLMCASRGTAPRT